ncbi:MAG: lipase family protein, partial [Tomitella sp.]|nr:lipase family protein [Tomitella sp.]
ALSRGWVVSIPDHEGSAGRWGIPREPGYLTLDGIRAAVGFAELGLTSSTQVGLWGYSGGGLATAWAVEMAPEYAPEIPILGGVLGSPVGDLPSAFLRLNGTLHAGLPTLVVAGLRRAYPELRRIIEQNVDAEGLALLASAENQSTAVAVVRLARHDLDDHLTMPLADLLALPEMVAVFDDLQVGTRAPTVPLLVVQAVHDQIIDVDDIDGLVGRYHAHGVHVTYRRDRLSEHLSLLPLSAPASLDYLSDRINGRELPPSGTSTVWSVTFSRAAARGLKVFVVNVVRMVFRRPISG